MKKLTILFVSLITLSVYSQNDSIKTISLTDVVVNGIRPGDKTPISQKTLTSNDINGQYFGQEMVFILGSTPSVNTSSDGGHFNGYSYFSIRGIDQTRVNMTLDGVPLNEPEDMGVYFSNYPGFAMNIKSLQIQRGVGTSANGTASYGGSINFESKNGLNKGISANISNGSFNTQTTNVNYASGLINNKFSLFTNISEYSSDGYRYHSGGSGYSGFISGGYYGTNDVVKLTAFTGRSLNKMAYLPSPIDSINKDPRHNPIQSDGDDFSQSFIQLQNVHSTDKNFVLTSTLYYNRLDGKYDVFGDYIQLGSNFVGFMTNYLIKINNLKINSGFHLNRYERVHSGSNDYRDPVKHPYINKGLKHEGSIYTKFNYDINKFNVFTDLQLRNIDFMYEGNKSMPSQNWLFFNPRAGVTYTISKNESVYLSIGNTHREPTRTNMFGGLDNLDSLYNVVPESVVDYELGYNLTTNNFKFQGNLFYMNFKDAYLQNGEIGSNSLPKMMLVEHSFRTGLESDLTYKINDNFTIDNTTALLYSKFYMNDDKINRVPLNSPLLMMSQDIVYTNGSLMVNLCGQVSSEYYIDLTNKNTVPSYLLLNLTVSYQFTKNVLFTIRGNNLTNTKYFGGGNVDNDSESPTYKQNYYFIGTPMNFYTTLNIKL